MVQCGDVMTARGVVLARETYMDPGAGPIVVQMCAGTNLI